MNEDSNSDHFWHFSRTSKLQNSKTKPKVAGIGAVVHDCKSVGCRQMRKLLSVHLFREPVSCCPTRKEQLTPPPPFSLFLDWKAPPRPNPPKNDVRIFLAHQDFHIENGSCQGQDPALTVSLCSKSLGSGARGTPPPTVGRKPLELGFIIRFSQVNSPTHPSTFFSDLSGRGSA